MLADSLSVLMAVQVGLAEVSPANPLKVLHALLERSDFVGIAGTGGAHDGSGTGGGGSDSTGGMGGGDVAVVGISNWSLDVSICA